MVVTDWAKGISNVVVVVFFCRLLLHFHHSQYSISWKLTIDWSKWYFTGYFNERSSERNLYCDNIEWKCIQFTDLNLKLEKRVSRQHLKFIIEHDKQTIQFLEQKRFRSIKMVWSATGKIGAKCLLTVYFVFGYKNRVVWRRNSTIWLLSFVFRCEADCMLCGVFEVGFASFIFFLVIFAFSLQSLYVCLDTIAVYLGSLITLNLFIAIDPSSSQSKQKRVAFAPVSLLFVEKVQGTFWKESYVIPIWIWGKSH